MCSCLSARYRLLSLFADRKLNLRLRPGIIIFVWMRQLKSFLWRSQPIVSRLKELLENIKRIHTARRKRKKIQGTCEKLPVTALLTDKNWAINGRLNLPSLFSPWSWPWCALQLVSVRYADRTQSRVQRLDSFITLMVEWALKTNHLSTYFVIVLYAGEFSSTVACQHFALFYILDHYHFDVEWKSV